MKILVEGHSYDAALVRDICRDFETVENGRIKVTKIGYYFNSAINDCVLCLPKIVCDASGATVFGGLPPENLIDAFSSENQLSEEQTEFIRSFSLWTYRAISAYARLNPDSDIVTKSGATESSGEPDVAEGTLLDVILDIIRFFNANRDYFIYIIRNLHSGYDRINWQKTIRTKAPVYQDGQPYYLEVINRRKQIDFDEELMIIFHSILHYISSELGLDVRTECCYEPITGAQFEAYLDGYGLTRLNAIKYKYFSDKDIRLWKLCRAFFLKTAGIQEKENICDYLLVSNFEIVFEAMMDALISDADLPELLKKQKDGKIVDHLFRYRSPIDDREIYYIGDSKYYSIGSTVGDNSIYKQFTYAKNIIQYHFARSTSRKLDEMGYRDPLTEGYNFTPNFFISAFIPDTLSFGNSGLTLRDFSGNGAEEDKHRIFHFENRLFDRDTLWLFHFDINLLYVMSLYASSDPTEQTMFKESFKDKVFQTTLRLLNTKYIFLAIKPLTLKTKEFVQQYFYLLHGKIYSKPDGTLMLALEKEHPENEALLEKLRKVVDISQDVSG